MEFIKNDLIDETLLRYYETFKCMLDTADYVPEKYNDKISKFIFKNLKKKFKEINREYKKLLKKNKAAQPGEAAEPAKAAGDREAAE